MMKYAWKNGEMPAKQVAPGLVRRLISTENLMLVEVVFTDGPTAAPDPFHSHPHEQVSSLIEGEIYLFVDDEDKVHLKPGDAFAIPSGIQHTIQRLSPRVKLIDCFTPLREDFLDK
jgi:quercetin dioxygenase-like cupin family protein